jgi:putative hydrolase of the HAD superfamily
MMNKKYKDVFFDLDHTLWDFDKNSKHTFKKILIDNKINIDIDVFLNSYIPINIDYWKLYRENNISKDKLRYGRLNDTFKLLNIDISTKIIYKLSDDYIKYLSSFNFLIDDTIPILKYLNSRYNLHIITNGFQEVQNLKLINSGIDHFFKTITNSEMAGVKKPNQKIFQLAINKAKTDFNSSIMIGDNLDADIHGALNTGMDAILFNYHKISVPKGVSSIDKLNQLKDYL